LKITLSPGLLKNIHLLAWFTQQAIKMVIFIIYLKGSEGIMLVTIKKYQFYVAVQNHLVKTKQAFCFLETGEIITRQDCIDFFSKYKEFELVEPVNN